MVKSFTFEGWKNNFSSDFRKQIKDFSELENLRKIVLLSTDLNQTGISFYLFVTDFNLGEVYKKHFGMEESSNIVEIDKLGIDFGNTDLIPNVRSNFNLASI